MSVVGRLPKRPGINQYRHVGGRTRSRTWTTRGATAILIIAEARLPDAFPAAPSAERQISPPTLSLPEYASLAGWRSC